MKIVIILGILAAAANILLIWYAKKYHKSESLVSDEYGEPKSESPAFFNVFVNNPTVELIRKSAAAELGMPLEELDRVLAKEMKQLSREQDVINIG